MTNVSFHNYFCPHVTAFEQKTFEIFGGIE